MIPLSQRDSRWSKFQLGTSNTTIGSHGCTITCIAMLVGTTPPVVNNELKRVGGFANGNLVIWSKVPEAFPQFTFVKRVKVYDNNDVKANLPCLVEVDFDGSPVTFGNHWVVFIGNQRLLDPWTGQNRPTSSYPILKGYAILKKKDDIIQLPEQAPVIQPIPQPEAEAVTPTPEDTPEVAPSSTEGQTGSETPTEMVPVDGGDIRPDSVGDIPSESGESTTSGDVGTGPSDTSNSLSPATYKRFSINLQTLVNALIDFLRRILK